MKLSRAILISVLLTAACAAGARASSIARHSHASVLLPDGNILVTGGIDKVNTTTVSVEMYNMATSKYENWGDLVTARSSHTATLMSDGRILIAGGFNSAGVPLSTLEICSPITKSCSSPAALAAMNSARGGHTATLLSKGAYSGQVLICGGQSGASQTTITETCDRFDPAGSLAHAAGEIYATNPMSSARMGHAAVLLNNGKVFATGGRRRNLADTAWVYLPTNEIYDQNSDAWMPAAALMQGRVDHTATVLNNGIIMVAGGYNEENTYKCDTLGTEECWTDADRKAWTTPGAFAAQNMGSHGYLDGAEFFDQNGGRSVLGESTFGTAPYRFSKHSAVLLPDGSWRMFGGYGGIPRTVTNISANLNHDSVFYLTRTGATSASVNDTSIVSFPVNVMLSRYISGRLTDADAFFARPKDGSPSVSITDADIFLGDSIVPLDGKPVGTLNGDNVPGNFNAVMTLADPSGTVTFSPVPNLKSDPDNDSALVVSSYNAIVFESPDLYPLNSSTKNSPMKLVGGHITAYIDFTLPKSYRGITGTVTIKSGSVKAGSGEYLITLADPGTGNISVASPSSCDSSNCIFRTTTTFPVVGATIANLTQDTTIQASLLNGMSSPTADAITLSYNLTFTADEIWTLDLYPAMAIGRSDIVIREMVFSSALGFTPSSGKWNDLSDLVAAPTIGQPVFGHTSVLTPAGDVYNVDGQNCELLPMASCLRTAKNFEASAAESVLLPVETEWTAGSTLNTKRGFHTSTMLRDGSILTCGGTDGVTMLSSCELMDPATKKWAWTASMNVPRSRHTATLLPNGNVLVAGGTTPSSAAVSAAEIFYPATRRWVLTSPMNSARQNHTATLLPDGNVLVAGGATVSTYSATTEVYISSAAYWMTTGPMADARAQHTATLLRSGNVLLAGGVNGLGALDRSEEYSYLTRACVPALAKTMTTPRFQHTAVLLRDGRVLVIGGSNNAVSQLTSELYDGSSWTTDDSLLLTYNRTGHRSILLPNGKVMVTGGETAGAAQKLAEGFDSDFPSWSEQGAGGNRAHHTTMLTKDNYLINIGGWDGSKYLNTTDITYFSYFPDYNGFTADVQRQPVISTSTSYLNWGQGLTVQSDYANFHGRSEASGGAAGPANSSQSNPRIYVQQIDNPSGFLVDLSTRIYSVYGGLYGGAGRDWEETLSSITVTMPGQANELPHGWYQVRVAANGQFSNGGTLQVTVPRPTGTPTVPAGNVLGTSSVTWTWGQGSVSSADSYSVYAASDSVFITTVTFGATASYTQTGLQANTMSSVMVNGVNLGGDGPLAHSATYYTLAAQPLSLAITTASFETAGLEWSPNGNSAMTSYEISMAPGTDNFADPLAISTPVPFGNALTSTATVIDKLSPNKDYYFRVRARNGDGTVTAFSNVVTTITVGNVNNLTGTAVSSSAINWSWDNSAGASYYELYDVTAGTNSPVYVGSTAFSSYSQGALQPNTRYMVRVNAVKTTGNGPVKGPSSKSAGVYTLTIPPLPATPNVFTQVSTGSLTVNWITNGNSTWTVYEVLFSTNSNFVDPSSATTAASAVTFSGLIPNTSYFAEVMPLNGDNVAGATVYLGTKYTLARPPASVTPSVVSMSGVTLVWDTNGNSSTTIFEVRGSTDNFANSVSTYVPFSALFTGSELSLSGLLTSTTYYFDVAACNGEGMAANNPCTDTGVTARIRAVPDAVTVAGPSGAPAGSIGGTSDPSQAVTISGVLSTGRTVSLQIPAGTFPAATAVAVSSSAQNPCSYTISGKPITVEVFSAGSSQPQLPVTLTLNYTGSESLSAIDADKQNLVLARYNPLSGQCLPLETVIDPGTRTIKATLNHFSLFQLMKRAASSSLSDAAIYPNPFYTNRGNGFVTLSNMPASSKVRMYTLSGDKVWEGTAGTTGILIWKGVNKDGYQVASGIYMVVIDSSAGKKVLKLAVER